MLGGIGKSVGYGYDAAHAPSGEFLQKHISRGPETLLEQRGAELRSALERLATIREMVRQKGDRLLGSLPPEPCGEDRTGNQPLQPEGGTVGQLQYLVGQVIRELEALHMEVSRLLPV